MLQISAPQKQIVQLLLQGLASFPEQPAQTLVYDAPRTGSMSMAQDKLAALTLKSTQAVLIFVSSLCRLCRLRQLKLLPWAFFLLHVLVVKFFWLSTTL